MGNTKASLVCKKGGKSNGKYKNSEKMVLALCGRGFSSKQEQQ